MASATSCPPIVPDPFDLGIHTPANLNRGAHTTVLQNSPAVVNGPVGVPPAFGRTAQTPASPLNAISTAAATEGAQLAHPAPSADPAPTTEQQPVSLIETATKLARDHAEEYNAKFKPPHRQGQPIIGAPLQVDLHVFIRLDAEAPARAHNDYAIRAHISRKLGVDPRKIPRILQVRDRPNGNPDLGAAAVETRQEWFTYLVFDYPRKLTDLYGNKADSDAAVDEEIEIQIVQKPVNIRPAQHQPDNPLTKTLLVSFLEPVKKYWRLFSSRPARLIKKTDRPRQCNVCLDYHRSRTCHRLPLCKRCGKVPPVHDCALALADSERYDTYSPVETWNSNSTRPRVMTYIRRDSTLSADQNQLYQSRDILWLTVNDTIVTGLTMNRGHEIASWASENGLGLLNTSDILINPHGNTIDLAFSNIPLAEANFEDHLATSSDHFTLSLTLPNAEPAPTQPGEIRLDKANALRRATLEHRKAEDDIQDPWIEVSPRKTIPFPHKISLEEAQDATLRSPVSVRDWNGRFGYADDTAILCIGDMVEETAATASRSIKEMVRWGAANRASFDPKKTKVIHFSQSKLEAAPAIRHGDIEKHPEAAMRWLGIWLDSSLSFRVYAEK
ncbi:hypothetical protein ACKAV7_015225 [Fusarium commune]